MLSLVVGMWLWALMLTPLGRIVLTLVSLLLAYTALKWAASTLWVRWQVAVAMEAHEDEEFLGRLRWINASQDDPALGGRLKHWAYQEIAARAVLAMRQVDEL